MSLAEHLLCQAILQNHCFLLYLFLAAMLKNGLIGPSFNLIFLNLLYSFMFKLSHISLACMAALIWVALPTGVQAADDDIVFLAQQDDASLFESQASDTELDATRGMSGLNFTSENLGVTVLTGVAANNTVNGGITGDNSLTDNALSNAQGVSFVVQNTGNNSVVNAAMVVNVSLSQ